MLVAGVSVKRTVTTIVTVITLIVFFFPLTKKKKKLLHSYLLLSIYIYSLWQTLLLSKAAVYSRGYKLEVVVSSIETMVRVFVFVYITGRRGWETFEWFALKVYACVCKREIWRVQTSHPMWSSCPEVCCTHQSQSFPMIYSSTPLMENWSWSG